MAINKKLVHFKTFANFKNELDAGNILDISVCWIKDTQQMYTHGQYYNCSGLTEEQIEKLSKILISGDGTKFLSDNGEYIKIEDPISSKLTGYTESTETNENLELTVDDTILSAFGKLAKTNKDNELIISKSIEKLRDASGLDSNLNFSTTSGDTNVKNAIERLDNSIKNIGEEKLPEEIKTVIVKLLKNETVTSEESSAAYNSFVYTSKTYLYNPSNESDEFFSTISSTLLVASPTILILKSYGSLTLMISGPNNYGSSSMVLATISESSSGILSASMSGVTTLGGGGDVLQVFSNNVDLSPDNYVTMAFNKGGDGTKFLSDDGTYKSAGGGVDITDIMNRVSEAASSSGSIPKDDYDNLKLYIESGSQLVFKDTANSGLYTVYCPNIDSGGINLLLYYPYGQGVTVFEFYIKDDYSVTVNNYINFNSPYGGNSNLGGYRGNVEYSTITSNDTINKAIAKLDAKYGKKEDGGTGAVTKTLSPNVFYQFGEVTSLTLTLGAEISGIYNEYMFQFTCGTTPATLGLPSDIKWLNGEAPTIEANKTYQVSIVNKLAVIGGF